VTLAEATMTRNVLDLPTLVLNRDWQPVNVTTVVRALVMLWNETAKAVEPDEYRLYDWADWSELPPRDGRPCVRSAHRSLRAPEVICLARYDRPPGAVVPFSRRNVARRDHYTCQYCGAQPGVRAITIDHVVPRSQGGASSWTNCVAACIKCNVRKADRTLEQAGMRPRRRPVRPDWKPAYATHDFRGEHWARFVPGEPSMLLA
jgi:5-methylcytosine-specific restriction endonuclease McrA